MQFDLSVRLGEVLTLVGFIATMIGAAYVVREQVKSLTNRMVSVETELKKMTDVMVQLGRQDERLNSMDRRIDDLQHGRGFVLELPGSGAMRAGPPAR
jgi:TolA-binding protein